MKQATEQQYIAAHRKVKMRALSTFSDPDGTMPFGNKRPRMETDWGFDIDYPKARCILTKKDRHQMEWDCAYFLDDELFSEYQPQEPQPETERTDGEPENELLISPKEFWLGEAQI